MRSLCVLFYFFRFTMSIGDLRQKFPCLTDREWKVYYTFQRFFNPRMNPVDKWLWSFCVREYFWGSTE